MTNKTLNKQFLTACEKSDTAKVKRLFERGAYLEFKDKEGNTALSTAASNGDTETVVFLLGCGADKESRNQFGYTALIFSAIAGEIETCMALLDHGVDLEVKDNKGHSALTLAARYGLATACEALIERNADVESKNIDGLSALALAAKYGEAETIWVLIACGANVDSVYPSRKTSLFADHVCDYLQYPLHHAAEQGMTKACIQMLDLGYDVDQQDNKGMNPVQLAQAKFQDETVAALRSWTARQVAQRIMREMDRMAVKKP